MKKLSFPLSKTEAVAFKHLLERGHKNQIYLSDLLKFIAPSSVQDVSLLQDTILLNEDLVYLGLILAVEKYQEKIRAKILRNEPLKDSINLYNEFHAYVKGVNRFADDEKIEKTYLGLFKDNPKRTVLMDSVYKALKENELIPSYYEHIMMKEENGE